MTTVEPIEPPWGPAVSGKAPWTVLDGDALHWLSRLPEGSVDAVVTDPPYSSGGLFQNSRSMATARKYVLNSTRIRRPDFSGDTRDQRSWTHWTTLWLTECLRITRPGGVLLSFVDWRQLPSLTDAVQAAGWLWRGVVVWDKTQGIRSHAGRFRQQAEFIVWASRGALPSEPSARALPGIFTAFRDALSLRHQAGKPISLLERLIEVTAPGGLILDPFAGSGSTGVAALRTGRRFLGVEIEPTCRSLALEALGAQTSGQLEDLRRATQKLISGRVSRSAASPSLARVRRSSAPQKITPAAE